MTLLDTTPFRRTLAAAAATLVLLAAPSGAQTELSHTDDASPVPRGAFRLRATTGWTRWDQKFGANGVVGLGDELSADPLGTAQLPLLTPIETSARALTADPQLRLSLGRLVTKSDARIVTTPIALEYGLTRRLSVGVIVPFVSTRRTVGLDVNSATGTPANVGFVPVGSRATAGGVNAIAYNSYLAAASSLGSQIALCRASPSASGCAAIDADASGAAAAQALATKFANAIKALGTDQASAIVAPRAGGVLALQIELQRNALNRLLQQYLGGGSPSVSAVYFAPTNFSYIDLQGRDGQEGLLQSALGGGIDSLRTTEHIGFGDISVGAQFLVFDGFQRDTLPLRGMQSRLVVGADVRFATSRADTAQNLVGIGTGDGAGVGVHSALDLIHGHVGGTIAGRYVKSFARTVSAPLYGDPEAAFPIPVFGNRQRTAGDVVGLDVTPRYLLTETFAIDGHYGLERVGAATYGPGGDTTTTPAVCILVSCAAPVGTSRTAQRLGVGLRYSTVDAFARGAAAYPVEVSYTHLSTISGDPGLPKLSRDQVQVRLFYQLFSR